VSAAVLMALDEEPYWLIAPENEKLVSPEQVS
jgi:hypothetical protein